MEKDFRVKCDCGSEEIHVDSDNDRKFGFIDLSIWYMGANNTLGLWQKIKYCWMILIKSRPYGDQICLTKETSKELGEHLIEVSEDMIEYKKKLEKEIRVMLHPSLYVEFKKKCKKNYKTISEVVRDMIVNYINKNAPK